MAAMRAWFKANLISLLARIGLSKFVVLAVSDRHWMGIYLTSAFGLFVFFGLFISAFFVK